jgi:hypothetical protein
MVLVEHMTVFLRLLNMPVSQKIGKPNNLKVFGRK